MRYDDYLAARRTRLVEHAAALGAGTLDEDDAGRLVDEVLERHRRRIERAADPDDLVHDALAEAVLGRSGPARRPSGRVVAAAVGAAVLVLVVVAFGFRPRPAPPTTPVPALFGLDASTAATVLHEAGFGVAVVTMPACEPVGLVLGSTPASGRRVEVGSRVVVRSAAAAPDPCPDLLDRTAAWAFVGFVRAGPSAGLDPAVVPAADPVVLTTGSRSPVSVRGAARRGAWPAALDALAHELTAPATGGTRTPRLVVRPAPEVPLRCGPDPAAGRPDVLRLQVQPDPRRTLPCPLTVDLTRVDGSLTAVTIRAAEALPPGREVFVVPRLGRGVVPR